MLTLHSIVELHAQVTAWRQLGERIVFVPTMGNLHQGHIQLVERAKTWAGRTVVSIFVNPLQFGPKEDYHNYPRTLEEDSRKLARVNLDLLFVPSVTAVYPRNPQDMTRIEVPGLSDILCGAFRPGHFAGVATVVTKLLNMVQPDVALFGEKDWQQLLIIRRLVADLNLPVEIVGFPTVREADGLAMSSRNSYLATAERAIAPTLYMTLKAAAQRLLVGEQDFQASEAVGWKALEAAGFRPDYFEIRRAKDLGEPTQDDAELLILAAAWLGKARLIDNYPVTLPKKAKSLKSSV
jgi:pantoate--beta-alanine ligase